MVAEANLGQNADATRHFRPFERVLSSYHLASPSRQQARGPPAEIQGLKTASTLGSKTTSGGDSGGEVNWQIGPLGRTSDAVPTAGSPGRTHDIHASFRGGDKLSEALDWKLQNIITSWRPLRSGRSETRSLELGGWSSPHEEHEKAGKRLIRCDTMLLVVPIEQTHSRRRCTRSDEGLYLT